MADHVNSVWFLRKIVVEQEIAVLLMINGCHWNEEWVPIFV